MDPHETKFDVNISLVYIAHTKLFVVYISTIYLVHTILSVINISTREKKSASQVACGWERAA